MLSASVGRIAEQLWRYGEDEAALWVWDCTDDELARISSVAGWLIFYGPRTAKGSMMFAKAVALAAVYVREGAPRELARKVRRPEPPPGAVADPGAAVRRTGVGAMTGLPKHYGVGDDARAHWGREPARSKPLSSAAGEAEPWVGPYPEASVEPEPRNL